MRILQEIYSQQAFDSFISCTDAFCALALLPGNLAKAKIGENIGKKTVEVKILKFSKF